MEPLLRTTLARFAVLFAAAIAFAGCYASRQINSPKEGMGEKLEIVTTSGRVFSFDSWSVDSLETVNGIARFDRTEAYASIPSRDISSIRASHLDQEKTVLVVATTALTVYGVVYAIKAVDELRGAYNSALNSAFW